jgi:hypothetical protein
VGKPEGKTSLGRARRRWILTKWDMVAWTGSSWLMVGTGGGALVNAVMNLAANRLASQEVHCSME